MNLTTITGNGRLLLTALVIMLLTGCASKRSYIPADTGSRQGGGESAMTEMPSDIPHREATQGIRDPAVMAVIESGQIKGEPAEIQLLLRQNIFHFKFDSDQIDPADFKALDAHAVLFKTEKYKSARTIIAGNTDERGTRTYNISLGLRRANAIRDYLILRGVNADNLRVLSYGFEKPMDPDHNPDAWAKNRRVELEMTA